MALLSYVLEIFGEHALSLEEILGLLAISFALIGGYGLHATQTAFPLLQLDLFRIRTFSAAVSGSFFTPVSYTHLDVYKRQERSRVYHGLNARSSNVSVL